MDLTGATVRLVARTRSGEPLVLASTVTDPAQGEVTHVLTGTLPIDRYRIELEATTGGEVITFPNDTYATLTVIPDLD